MKSRILKVLAVAAMVMSAPSLCMADAAFAKIVSQAKARYQKHVGSIQDMTTQLQTQVSSPSGVMTQNTAVFSKGNKFRAETSMEIPGMPAGFDMGGMGKSVVISDGSRTWMISPMGGRMEVPTSQDAQYRQDSTYWDRLGDEAKVVGSESIRGRDCYIVETQWQEGAPPAQIWLDKKDLMIMKVQSRTEQGSLEMLYSDFRDVRGGWKTPFKIETLMNGTLFSTTQIRSIEFDRGLPDELFDPSRA